MQGMYVLDGRHMESSSRVIIARWGGVDKEEEEDS
jgi:hypothetical protein